jgi:hypothetical protein
MSIDEGDYYELVERVRRVEDFAIAMEPILADVLEDIGATDDRLSPEDLRAAVEAARDAAHNVATSRW